MNKRNKKTRKIVVAIIIILVCLITFLIVKGNSIDTKDNKKNHKKVSKQIKNKNTKAKKDKTTNSDSSNKENIANNETDKKKNNNTSQNTKVTTTNKECPHDWEAYGHYYDTDSELIVTDKILQGKNIHYICGCCNQKIKTKDGKYNIDIFKEHLLHCKVAIDTSDYLFAYQDGDKNKPVFRDDVNNIDELVIGTFSAHKEGKFKVWQTDGYKCKLCGEVASKKDYPYFYGNGD